MTTLALLRQRTPLGWLQLKHNRARLAAAVAGVAFANILIFMQLGFLGALTSTSVAAHRGWDADIVLFSAQADTLETIGTLPRRRMFQALAVEGVAEAGAVHVARLTWTDRRTGEETTAHAFGIDPDFRAFLIPEIAGRQSLLKVPDTALFDRLSRGDYTALNADLDGGREIEFEAAGRRLTLVGLFALGASFAVDGNLVTSDDTFLRLFPAREAGAPSMIFLRVAPGADPASVAARLREVLPAGDTQVKTRDQMIEAELQFQSSERPIGFVFSFGVVIGIIVGLVIVYQVLSTDVADHLSEYATLKAIGYAQRYFLGIVAEEAVILAVLGFIPGMGITLALYALAAKVTALPIAMSAGRALFVLALTVFMCGVSGAIATRRLAQADPADLF